LAEHLKPASSTIKHSRTGTIGIYLFLAAQVIRTLTDGKAQERFPWYLGLLLAYLVLFTAALWLPGRGAMLSHLYFLVQSAIILALVSLNPQMDYVTSFFIPLSYQAALVFAGRPLWGWVSALFVLTVGSLVFYRGPIQSLALSLTTMAGVIVLPAYVVATQQIDKARAKSQALLGELQETHQQLQSYAGQVEELAALEERDRLARELHDTVSQLIFSITLTTRSAQMLLERDPARVPDQIRRLQEMTGDALSRLRSLITQLRPPQII
jgi:signal transduction histidine kinase